MENLVGNMFDGFFAGKKVFLTGHTGFKGAWLALWLRRMGAEIGAFSLEPPSKLSLWELANVEQDVTRLGGDIRNVDEVSSAMLGFKPDIVIHMAAQSLVRPSYDKPVETFMTNVMGTVNVLEAIHRCGGVKGVINVTSDKCYDNREWVWGYRESDPMGGYDPYSASKGCAELVCASYTKSFLAEAGTPVGSVRAGNVIGGGDFAKDRLIPDMVRAFTAGDFVHVRSPRATRPWQHVLEPLTGYLLLARRLVEHGEEYAGGWNFGPADDSARTVGEVVERFAAIWGDSAGHKLDSGDHPHEAYWLKLDCSKASRLLGWTPRTGFVDALTLTADWYKGWADGKDVRKLTLAQLEEFEGLQ